MSQIEFYELCDIIENNDGSFIIIPIKAFDILECAKREFLKIKDIEPHRHVLIRTISVHFVDRTNFKLKNFV